MTTSTVRNAHRLTHRQLGFLYAVRDFPQTLDQLTERLKVQPWLLSKWLRSRPFRQALAEVLKEMHRRRHLEFQLAARQATNVMSQLLAGGEGTHLVRQTSFDVLDLFFTRKRPGRQVIKVPTTSSESPGPLIHPDVSPEQALEHIEALEGKQGAD